MASLRELWNRWLRGGRSSPTPESEPEEEERLLTTTSAESNVSLIPPAAQDAVLDEGYPAERDER